MAAAALQHLIPSGAHNVLKSSKVPSEPSPHDKEEEQREKQFVAEFESNKDPPSPAQVGEDSRSKQLGVSSRQLRLQDFELLKTLGTGAKTDSFKSKCSQLIRAIAGTFARVWLARLADPSPEHYDKVFALKILRKTDSK